MGRLGPFSGRVAITRAGHQLMEREKRQGRPRTQVATFGRLSTPGVAGYGAGIGGTRVGWGRGARPTVWGGKVVLWFMDGCLLLLLLLLLVLALFLFLFVSSFHFFCFEFWPLQVKMMKLIGGAYFQLHEHDRRSQRWRPFKCWK